MQHLDDGTIHAWLDGALGTGDAAAVEAHVAACRACAGRVAEARGLIAASSRILMALDDVPADVVPADTRIAAAAPVASPAVAATPPSAGPAAPRARWWGHRYGRLAAVLAFVVAGTLVLTREANRRDVAARRETPRRTDELRAQRDSAVARGNAPTAAPQGVAGATPPQQATPVPAPSAALGGRFRRPAPAPTLKPQVKSFAQEERQQAAAAKKSASDVNIAVANDANKAADSASRAVQAQASSTLARRIGEGKALQLSEVVVTSEAIGTQRPPRLVSVDSVQRGPVMVRRQTYVIGGGTHVLLEVAPASAVPNHSAAAAPGGAITDSTTADTSSTAIHAIHWRGADGTRYTLSGPVSIDELQRIRAALGNRP